MISEASTETLMMKEIMLDVCRFFSVRVSTISIFVGMQVGLGRVHLCFISHNIY